MSERPLEHLSDEDLVNLWRKSKSIDHYGHEDYDEFMTVFDLMNLRAALLAQISLCKKYNIPYPALKEDSLDAGTEWESHVDDIMEGEDQDFDEGDIDELFEYACENIHRYIDDFCDIDGIGDFSVEFMIDLEDALSFFREHNLDSLSDEFAPEVEHIGHKELLEEHGLYEDISVKGYRSALRIVSENEDCVYCDRVQKVSSKNAYELFSLFHDHERAKKIKELSEIWNVYTEILEDIAQNTTFLIPLEFSEEYSDKTWSCVNAMLTHTEDSRFICGLHQFLCLRIGAYVLQEFAFRYACNTCAVQ